MYCSECGDELLDKAVICPECGCATENYKKSNNDVHGGVIVLSYLAAGAIPIIGGILVLYFLATHRIVHAITLGVITVFMYYFWGAYWGL